VSKERLAESEAKEFVKQIVSALVSMINQQQYVHGLYIAHRDLKAEKILLDAQKNIKIAGKPSNDLDFGLSNCFEPHALLLTACGSPVYSAPEFIEGKSYSGPEADSWSLWINVYAMVVGDLPFADSNITALYEAILRGNYFVPDFVSQECRNFLTKVLDINPYKRWTMNQLSGDYILTIDHSWLNDGCAFLDTVVQRSHHFRPKTFEVLVLL
jgi:MAP/microtubule affinity-regulating kinase